ncbi:LysR family transcriptional regulator [Aliidiomarina sedimenti]|uniref:LysR family transcriptional regulator n=1 Tax=Aliidiomarina sedimenti TaxID=1933879 RepID=A0ABY0BVB0_9GAMM|nr:LysR family transcriptional regulator [Aliidiomarina sedimenti]RUO28050.1 LysR family transcriptional regulator [Aliidiomarina sedimenti]
MKHIPSENLRAFLSVYDLQSYTLAGERMGRSQPAISLQIKRLEQMLNTKLLQRQENRIRLTDAGVELYPMAQQLLNLNDQIIALHSESNLSGEVRLGIPSEFASTLLPSILGQFASSYPQVALQVTSGLSRDLRLGASRRQFDIILTVAESAPDNAILVKTDQLVWVAGSPDFKPSQPLALVMAPEGCVYRRRAEKMLSGHGYRISYTNSDLAGISSALRSGLGVTVLARSSVPVELHEVKHPTLPELGQINIYLERHGRSEDAAERLLRYIEEALR